MNKTVHDKLYKSYCNLQANYHAQAKAILAEHYVDLIVKVVLDNIKDEIRILHIS